MILLMGVIGAGKSLQGRLLASDMDYTLISTGELFRKHLSDEERKKMESGKLYSDEEVIQVVDKNLAKLSTKHELIFDGFPRTVVQAQWLMKQVEDGRLNLTAVFNLEASREVIAERLHNRGRIDDSENIIEERLNEYNTKTLPMINYFRELGVGIIDIDSNQPPGKVHQDIKSHLS